MKRIIWFFMGLIIGGAGVWAYFTSVVTPRVITETEVATKEQFEQSQLEKQMFVTAVVTSVNGMTIEATTEKEDIETPITIKISSGTKLYMQSADDASTQQTISLIDIAPGSVITVVTSGIIDLTQPINATSIIKI